MKTEVRSRIYLPTEQVIDLLLVPVESWSGLEIRVGLHAVVAVLPADIRTGDKVFMLMVPEGYSAKFDGAPMCCQWGNDDAPMIAIAANIEVMESDE